ncbi:MAG TPA: DinB family protein, partial [Longimicrobiaceae bacterium]|nr:DinB family protein [Longimicrobiaceae bacterium]
PEAPRPEHAAEIAATYRDAAASVGEAVRRAWPDDELGEMVEMYGDRWSKATVLSALIRHEAHHRGQMTVLMRQAGLVVPGVYGPAREEWEAMGVPPLP